MQLTVNAKELKQAVTWTSKIIRKPLLPILDCVLLSAKDGKVTVRATNLKVDLTRVVNATVSEPGQVCVNAKSLKEYLRGIKGKGATVSIESKPTLLVTLEANGITITLPDGNPEEFPLAANAIWDHAFAIDPNAIQLKQIAKFADHERDNGRVVLKCVFIEVYNGEDYRYRMTTADGFRLATTNAISGDKVAEYLLPYKAAEIIASLKTSGVLKFGSRKYEDGSEDGSIVGYAEFTTDDSAVVSKLEDGKFPDYSQIIPADDRGTWVTLDTEQLATALEAMVTVTNATKRYRARPTTLKLHYDMAMLSATSEDGDEIETILETDWTGEEGFTIGLNAKYVLDSLALCGKQTRIMLESPSRPLLIAGIDCQMVVMPMHIKR